MAEVSLNIHGKAYGISCDDGQEGRVIEVGKYVDRRARDIASAGAASNENHLLVLTALVLADEIKELQEHFQNPGQGGFPVEGLSTDEERRIVRSIEQLAVRLDSVTSKLRETGGV